MALLAGRMRLILPLIYLCFALYAWIDFAGAARDGLANVGLFLVTLPVTLVGFGIDAIRGSTSFSLLPSGHGYVGDHALFFVPAVAATAALTWVIGRAIDRRAG